MVQISSLMLLTARPKQIQDCTVVPEIFLWYPVVSYLFENYMSDPMAWNAGVYDVVGIEPK